MADSAQIQQADSNAPAELSAVVDELLNTLSNKFAGVSSEIFAKSQLKNLILIG